jgi:monoamine oxidase
VSAAGFVRGFHAADPDLIGAHSLAPVHGKWAGGEHTTAARIADGQDAIPRWLAQDLTDIIRTRAVVTEIAWKRHAVDIRMREGTPGAVRRVSARAVVVTIPLGVLKARPGMRGSIAFRPDPPATRDAISRLAMGSVTKVVFAFDELPWSKVASAKDVGFLRTPDSDFTVWWSTGLSRAPLAVAWGGGPPAAALDLRPPAEIIATALRDLSRALGLSRSRLEASVRGTWLHDWQHDPFSRGAYSYPQVGGMNAGQALARPVEVTLYFAGEATSRAWGTVEGALASGLRAARQVDPAEGS